MQRRALHATPAAVLRIGAGVDLTPVSVLGVTADPGRLALRDPACAAGTARVAVRQVANVAARSAVFCGGEQVGLAGVLRVPVALVGSALAVERTGQRGFVASAALAIGGFEARRTDAAAVAKRTAAIHVELVPVTQVVVTAGAGAESVGAAHVALAIRGDQTPPAVATTLAVAATISPRFVAIHHAVPTAGLGNETIALRGASQRRDGPDHAGHGRTPQSGGERRDSARPIYQEYPQFMNTYGRS